MDDTTTITSVARLEPHECWAQLRTSTLGRLAVVVDQKPDILPVNYVVDHGGIVFRSDVGTKLSAMLDRPFVAFEVDGQDGEICWSVVVKGRARQIRGLHKSVDLAELPLYPQHAGSKSNFIELMVDEISGRRFAQADPTVWATALTGLSRSASE
jgi:hypothetical protein